MPHYNDWLQVTQPFTSGEDEHSLYELQHPPNPIMTQHVIKTIVALNTPQYSVQDNDSEVELPRQVINIETPPIILSRNIVSNQDHNATTDDPNNHTLLMNNNTIKDYLSCFHLCPMIDNESFHIFMRKLDQNIFHIQVKSLSNYCKKKKHITHIISR